MIVKYLEDLEDLEDLEHLDVILGSGRKIKGANMDPHAIKDGGLPNDGDVPDSHGSLSDSNMNHVVDPILQSAMPLAHIASVELEGESDKKKQVL
ncbi:hypothetical protein R1flu_027811 [Riccia fluitans]|uniref:Uncharacterized protein n=1 Tax=Riccia fluitans TaxID=41844 RepID=A0ABD1XNY2_9MARC